MDDARAALHAAFGECDWLLRVRDCDARFLYAILDLERLPQITAPTLVVVGDQDILTPVADARELAAGIPGARLRVLAGGGHLALGECNDAFMDALLAFLVA